MPHTDPISDMLTRVRNSVSSMHEFVEMPASKIKVKIAEILQKEGYISSYEVITPSNAKKILKISLKYGPRNQKVITGIKRISKSGLRVYTKAKVAPRVLGGLGISIISTSRGLMTDKESRKKKLGGEVICQVW